MLQFKFQHRLDWLTQRFASGFCIPHPKIIRQKQTWVGGVMVSDVGYDSGDCSDSATNCSPYLSMITSLGKTTNNMIVYLRENGLTLDGCKLIKI